MKSKGLIPLVLGLLCVSLSLWLISSALVDVLFEERECFLLARAAGGAFWVPSQNPGRAERRHGCIVLTQNLIAEEYWMPAGTYIDHWMLREGVPTPPASHLLTLPGTTALSRLLVARLPGWRPHRLQREGARQPGTASPELGTTPMTASLGIYHLF